MPAPQQSFRPVARASAYQRLDGAPFRAACWIPFWLGRWRWGSLGGSPFLAYSLQWTQAVTGIGTPLTVDRFAECSFFASVYVGELSSPNARNDRFGCCPEPAVPATFLLSLTVHNQLKLHPRLFPV